MTGTSTKYSLNYIINSLALADVTLKITDVLKYITVCLVSLLITLYLCPPQISIILILLLIVVFAISFIILEKNNTVNYTLNKTVDLDKLKNLRQQSAKSASKEDNIEETIEKNVNIS